MSRWLDPRGVRAAILFSLAAALLNGIWLALDDAVPPWDQSYYLATTLHYQDVLSASGPFDLLRAIKDTDPSHGPLFTVLLLPLVMIFGPDPSSAMLLNLLAAPVLYFAAGEIAYIVFRDWRARLLTIALVATMPILVGLFHNVLQDFLLVTLATLSLLFLLKSEGFRHRGYTFATGAAMGLGTLTKVTFPGFVIAPLLVIVVATFAPWLAARRAGRPAPGGFDGRQIAINVSGALAILLAIALVWYGPNLQPTLDYIRSTTSGPLAEGAGPKDPITFEAITSFTLRVINFHVTWVVLLTGLIAAAFSWRRLRALFEQPRNWRALTYLAFLLSWAVVPYLLLATASNQDVRLMASAMPAVAILVAGAVCAVRIRAARLALASVVLVFLVYQAINHTTDVTPGFLPEEISLSAGEYTALVPLDSQPIEYERLPGKDYVTPAVEYIEEVAASLPGGAGAPHAVCVLESEAAVNLNTYRYALSARELPYGLAEMTKPPGTTDRELESALSNCTFALYVKPPANRPGGDENRLTIVNENSAAAHMTPSMFALFGGSRRSFPISEESADAKRGGKYLNAAGGDRVWVLTRTPGAQPIP